MATFSLLATFSVLPSRPPSPPSRPPSPSAPDFSCVDSSFEEINIAGEESTSTSLSVPRQGIASSLQIDWWHQCPAGVSFTLVAPDSSELELFEPTAWVHAGTGYQANTSPLCGSLQALTVFEDGHASIAMSPAVYVNTGQLNSNALTGTFGPAGTFGALSTLGVQDASEWTLKMFWSSVTNAGDLPLGCACAAADQNDAAPSSRSTYAP